MRLDDLSWPEVAARASHSVLAVPVGSTEQHGPHLPLSTDTDIALELCHRLASTRADVLVAPAVGYGSAGEHAGFPGTLSIGAVVTEELLVELARSADDFSGVLFVSCHGGNAAPVRRAVGRLVAESRRVRAWSPGPVPVSVDNAIRDGGAHAGWTETAVILALRSGTVRLDRAAAGPVEPLRRLMPALQAGGVRSVSPNGVLGDPSGATAEAGEKILAGWGRDLVAAVAGWPAPTAGPGAGG
ncbi:MAG TPA: mycofactocin biosynthesis peptidyl-dipeptidase MftE [Acidimicrobiales bacterium]|nr:mycofactocin biosynthesis peptidyl-dipeptidase MftE [Acidimicrobiales bacterium]